MLGKASQRDARNRIRLLRRLPTVWDVVSFVFSVCILSFGFGFEFGRCVDPVQKGEGVISSLSWLKYWKGVRGDVPS